MASEHNDIKTYFGRCRCCLGYGYLKSMWKEYQWDGETEVYGDMLTRCYALSWEQPESVEHDQICEPCVTRLRDAVTFKKLVIKSQRELMREIEDDVVETEVKIEGMKMEHGEMGNSHDVTDENSEDYNSMAELSVVYAEPAVIVKEDAVFEDVEYLEEEIMPDGKPSTANEQDESSLEVEEVATRKRKWPKKLARSERYKRYLQYTEDDLRKALQAIKNNKMTRLEAAEYYNVPRKTLVAKLKLESEDVPGPNKEAIASIDKVETKSINKLKGKDAPKNPRPRARTRTIPPTELEKRIDDDEALADSVALQEMKKHRDNIRSVLQCSNATLIKGYWGVGYTCCFCPEQFQTPAELKRHNIQTHGDVSSQAIHVKYVYDLIIKLDITGLRCLICGMKAQILEKFMEHLSEEHKKTIHTDIKNHIVPFKFDTDTLRCVVCAKQFKFFKLLSEHMNEHYKNYECSVCGRGFVNKQSMQTHSYRHQKNIGEFKCTYCPRVFDTRHKRSAHVRIIHLHGSKTRKCHVCSEKFSSSQQVQNHMVKEHGAKPLTFACDACNKSYTTPRSLAEHTKRFHLMLRPHKCTVCDMGFYSKMELNTHMVTHTKTRDLQCEICDKRFGTKCCLNQHMRGHLGIKRYSCGSCDQKFASRTKWKAHMMKKHGEKV